jgi:hypothetical protein
MKLSYELAADQIYNQLELDMSKAPGFYISLLHLILKWVPSNGIPSYRYFLFNTWLKPIRPLLQELNEDEEDLMEGTEADYGPQPDLYPAEQSRQLEMLIKGQAEKPMDPFTNLNDIILGVNKPNPENEQLMSMLGAQPFFNQQEDVFPFDEDGLIDEENQPDEPFFPVISKLMNYTNTEKPPEFLKDVLFLKSF